MLVSLPVFGLGLVILRLGVLYPFWSGQCYQEAEKMLLDCVVKKATTKYSWASPAEIKD